MQISGLPTRFPVPFAASGTKNAVPVTASPTPGLASYTTGFTPLNMTPIVAGGIPPSGNDFNGVLSDITLAIQWENAGGRYPYSSSFSTSVGGYPKGALLARSGFDGFWISAADNNTTNPDTGGAGWIPLNGQGGEYAIDTGTANTYTVPFVPAVVAIVDGQTLKFKAKTANTGASTFNPNSLGAKPIVGGAHAALQGGEIIANGDVWVQYNSSIGVGSWVLIDSTGGALQVGLATKSQHAMQLSQAVGRLLNIQVITASGTYVPTVGMNNARVRGAGGTGGSGGVAATVAAQTAVSGGTAAGSYFETWLSAATIGASQSVIIGGAGAAGAVGANGSAGGATSFGALLNAPGSLGSGAAGAVSTSSSGVAPSGAQGAIATGGNIINGVGSAGASGLTVNGGTAPGAGGSSHLGAPGASGVTNNPSAAAKGGTAGSPGILIIEEYA